MTAREFITAEYRARACGCWPLGLLAHDTKEGSIAAWDDCKGRWRVVAGKTIMPGTPWVVLNHELLIDGKPIPATWTMVPPAA